MKSNMKKTLLLLLLILATSYYAFDELGNITGLAIQLPQESGNIQAYFCPTDNCTQLFLDTTANKELRCAMYDLDQPLIKQRINQSPHPVIIDDHTDITGTYSTIEDTSSGLMHNKFCIIGTDTVWTGSMNPTQRGAAINNNNVIIITSETIANNYLDEYEELKSGIFHKGNAITTPTTIIDNTEVTIAFCPEDNCKQQVLEELKSAQESIYFMTFSFTDKDIASVLIEKSKSMPVKGIMELSQAKGTYSVLPQLNTTAVEVHLDTSKATMHHKVFIIDEHTVITGSYNPTKSGDERNDENLLIIKDKTIAQQFIHEYNKVRIQS